MITVQILINGKVILCRSARNIGQIVDNAYLRGPMSSDLCEYHVDDGRKIRHYRGDGAVKLAMMMLEGVKEP